ncbi:MAG TPA: 3-dehydroquinate synthase, partial [Afifellaceae bacterium]|nr:3-dehydroquinate synthase [Afifellaceae bacterium]
MNRLANLESTTKIVHVALGERSYDIVIGSGLVAQAGALLHALLPDARPAIVTDENVAGIHLPALRNALAQEGI